MLRSRTGKPVAAYLVLGALLLLLLLLGLQIVGRQMETGNAYPEYSTFRSDPKGLRAFYDGLAATHEIDVSRLTTSTKKESSGRDKVMFMAGIDLPREFGTEEDAHLLNDWIASGGRLIVALNNRPGPALSAKREGTEAGNPSWEAFLTRWGTKMSALWMPQPYRANSSAFGDFPRWFASRYFDQLDPAWKVMVWSPSNKKEPLVIEREVGSGKIVLLSDSYILSNESLSVERKTTFLLWLLDNRRKVIFSELQLGINQKPGIMTLANRFGLQGLIIGLILTGLLFVWKSQYSLIPRSSTQASDVIEGRSAEEAFVALLRRTIKEKSLLAACVEAWRRTAKNPGEQPKALDTILSMRSGTPVQQYGEIDSLLKRRL